MYNWHAPPKLNNTFYVYCVVAMLGRWQCLLNYPYFIRVVPVSWPLQFYWFSWWRKGSFKTSANLKSIPVIVIWNISCGNTLDITFLEVIFFRYDRRMSFIWGDTILTIAKVKQYFTSILFIFEPLV